MLLFNAVAKLIARLSSKGKYEPLEDEEETAVDHSVATPHEGVLSDLKLHIKLMGGAQIFFYKVLRLLGCLTLVALTIVTLVVDENAKEGSGLIGLLKKKKHKGKRKPSHSDSFTTEEWLQVALLLTYVCIVVIMTCTG